MREQLLYKVGDVRLVESPKPECGPDDMLIRVRVCAVCPTDWRKFSTGDHGIPNWPFNMGHEWSGDVAEIGANVKGWTVGQRVAMVGYGGYADYFKVTPNQVRFGRRVGDTIVTVPDNVSYEDATFMEPFADCIHSVEQAQVRLGETLAVIGSGQMGLQHTIVGKLMGLKVIVSDILPERLELAKQVGADYVINAATEDPVARVKEITGGQGADGVCLTAGTAQGVVQSLQMVKRTGAIALFSGFKNGTMVTFDPNIIHYGEIVLTGSYGTGLKHPDAGLFKKSMELIATGRAPVGKLITHRFPLEELETALKAVGSYQALKAMIIVNP